MMIRPLGTTGLHMTETGLAGAIGGLYAAISRDAALVKDARAMDWDAFKALAVQCGAGKSALSLCGP